MTGDKVLASVPRQRQPMAPVVSVRSDPLTSPLSLRPLEPPAVLPAGMPLAGLLPVQRDRRLRRRGQLGALIAVAVAVGFAAVMWLVIAGSAMALGRAL